MKGISFSLNLFKDLQTMLQFDFMRHAFEAGTIIAIVAGILGFAGLMVAAAGIAKLLFYLFLILFLITLISGLLRKS